MGRTEAASQEAKSLKQPLTELSKHAEHETGRPRRDGRPPPGCVPDSGRKSARGRGRGDGEAGCPGSQATANSLHKKAQQELKCRRMPSWCAGRICHGLCRAQGVAAVGGEHRARESECKTPDTACSLWGSSQRPSRLETPVTDTPGLPSWGQCRGLGTCGQLSCQPRAPAAQFPGLGPSAGWGRPGRAHPSPPGISHLLHPDPGFSGRVTFLTVATGSGLASAHLRGNGTISQSWVEQFYHGMLSL